MNSCISKQPTQCGKSIALPATKSKPPQYNTKELMMMKSYLSIFLLAAVLVAAVSAFQSSSLLSHHSSKTQRRLHQLHSSPTQPSSTNTPTTSSSSSLNSSPAAAISTAIQSHHVAVKTRNIEVAIKFYSLLGFHVETKFVAGPARAAWLLHGNPDDDDNHSSVKSRIELIEVPSYMLNEPEGTIK
eukprot:scaffold9971_cov75-Skeletonema_dohrnii-CCMP3373.AAC.2